MCIRGTAAERAPSSSLSDPKSGVEERGYSIITFMLLIIITNDRSADVFGLRPPESQLRITLVYDVLLYSQAFPSLAFGSNAEVCSSFFFSFKRNVMPHTARHLFSSGRL